LEAQAMSPEARDLLIRSAARDLLIGARVVEIKRDALAGAENLVSLPNEVREAGAGNFVSLLDEVAGQYCVRPPNVVPRRPRPVMILPQRHRELRRMLSMIVHRRAH
jgi:hypothetical protein